MPFSMVCGIDRLYLAARHIDRLKVLEETCLVVAATAIPLGCPINSAKPWDSESHRSVSKASKLHCQSHRFHIFHVEDNGLFFVPLCCVIIWPDSEGRWKSDRICFLPPAALSWRARFSGVGGGGCGRLNNISPALLIRRDGVGTPAAALFYTNH